MDLCYGKGDSQMNKVKTFNLTIWFKNKSFKTFHGISRSAVSRYIDYYWNESKNENYDYWSVVDNY